MQPLIIVLGGTHGVGKTTIAHELSKQLDIKSVIGLGPIIGALSMIKGRDPLLEKIRSYDHIAYGGEEAQDIEQKFTAKCEALGTILKKTIESYIYMGANCIIDGVEILPQFLPLELCEFIVITSQNSSAHELRLAEPFGTRTLQPIELSFREVKRVEDIIFKYAKEYAVPTFDNSGDFHKTTNTIIEHLNTKKM